MGMVRAGLYGDPALNEVVAPPPGMATRLCFSVEYRHSSEQLMVSLLRLGNLPPCFHGNVTLVEVRLLPDDRRPRQAKARGTGPDPEFNDYFIFQARTHRFSQASLFYQIKYHGKYFSEESSEEVKKMNTSQPLTLIYRSKYFKM